MTTATTSPLESYQQGRDKFLAVVLDAMSGLEGTVLDYQHEHEGKVRSSGSELLETLREKARLEDLVGEQALELEAALSHVCAVPEFQGDATEVSAPVAVAETSPAAGETAGADEAERTIAELRAGLKAEQLVATGLRADLDAEKRISEELRSKLAETASEISELDDALDSAEGKLQAAVQVHESVVRENEASFEQRLAAGLRTAETGVRGEALRIIDAIAADNPALAEVADLFTVAFPSEVAAAGGQEFPAPIQAQLPALVAAADEPAPADDFFASIPALEVDGAPTAPAVLAPSEWDDVPAAPTPADEDFFSGLSDPAPEAAPAPMTQVYLPAPGDDAIMDPNFFDDPAPAEMPAVEVAPAEKEAGAPKPSYGLFGRKKENQNA